MSDMDPTAMDAIAYGIAKLFHTPLDELKAEAAAHRRTYVGSKAGAWANQAVDYALNTNSLYVATAYMKPPPGHVYDLQSRWVVYAMPSREDLDNWYQGLVGMPDHYHYLAAYDKTTAEWARGSAVAAAVGDADAHVGAAPSTTDQLAQLDHLIARHEVFWAQVAQERPTPEVHEFYRHHWDPWFTQWWWAWRPYLDTEQGLAQLRLRLSRRVRTVEDAPGTAHFEAIPAPVDLRAAAIHEGAQGLSGLREYAAYNGIPTPDLGTSQHGFSRPGEQPMVTGDSYVGADESYRDVAIHAVMHTQHQNPSPAYGYLRTGIHQRVYLFHALDDARAWYDQREPGYNYAAVFVAPNLHAPVAEDFGQPAVSGDAEVGHWLLPLALGVPAGAAGGYYYRKWQEGHPGKLIPWISGQVDAPSIDTVGASPWIDLVGAQADSDVARRRAWPKTKALIHSAISDALASEAGVKQNLMGAPNIPTFYVWKLVAGPEEIGGPPFYANMNFFSSREEALDYARRLNQNAFVVATAVFDTTGPHWPNPVAWHKSDDPSHEWVIAEQLAKHGVSAHTAGWVDMVGAAIDVFRKQAQAAAAEMPGRVVGLRRDAHNQWQLEQFRSVDDADDWFGRATAEPARFTYAAYFDKGDPTFPEPLNEAIGGARSPSARGPAIRRGIGEVAA